MSGLVRCRCGSSYRVRGPGTLEVQNGCPACGQIRGEWPFESAAAERRVVISDVSKPDNLGRVQFTCDWVDPNSGRVRGQVFRTHLAAARESWEAAGYRVEVRP